MTKKTLVAMAATLALALPGMAIAGNSSNEVVVDGTTGLAKQVCGWVNGSILPATPDYRDCVGSALDGARSDLNALAQRQG